MPGRESHKQAATTWVVETECDLYGPFPSVNHAAQWANDNRTTLLRWAIRQVTHAAIEKEKR